MKPVYSSYPPEPKLNCGKLPDPFRKPDQSRIASTGEWPELSELWKELIIAMEYGGMPPAPCVITFETTCHSCLRLWADNPNLWSYRIHCQGGEKSFSFTVQLLFPSTPGPHPVIIDGDGCWWYTTEEVAQEVVNAGYALLLFNRTEMAEDLGYDHVPDKHRREGGLYDVYPGQTFGALSAWAWGYQRCVDLLEQLPFIDRNRIATTGHSRGGKASLLAGATDRRISLVNDNASCAGGSAVFRYVGHDGETLDIINVFPSWFGDGLRPYLGKEKDIPFDQHCLLATIAPRPLLLTYSLDDRWSNPEGMVQCKWATQEVYRFLDAPDAIAFHLRNGPHAHLPQDWRTLIDFANWHWMDQKPRAAYNQHPYVHLSPAFDWNAPD